MHTRRFLAGIAAVLLSVLAPLPAAAQSGWPAGWHQQFPPVAPSAAPQTRYEEARTVRFVLGAGARVSMFDVTDRPSAEASAAGPVVAVGLRLSLGRYAEFDLRLAGHFDPEMNEMGERQVTVQDAYYRYYVERRHARSYFEGSFDVLMKLFPSGGRVYFGPGARAAIAVIPVTAERTWYGRWSSDDYSRPDDDVDTFGSDETLFQLQGLFGAGILIGADYQFDLGLRVAVGMMRGAEGLDFLETKGAASFELTMGVAL